MAILRFTSANIRIHCAILRIGSGILRILSAILRIASAFLISVAAILRLAVTGIRFGQSWRLFYVVKGDELAICARPARSILFFAFAPQAIY